MFQQSSWRPVFLYLADLSHFDISRIFHSQLLHRTDLLISHIVNKPGWAWNDFVWSWTINIYRVCSFTLVCCSWSCCPASARSTVRYQLVVSSSILNFVLHSCIQICQVELSTWDRAKSSSSLGTAPWSTCQCPYSCTCRLSSAARRCSWSCSQLINS